MNSYTIGDIPVSDPCEKCILKSNCSEECRDKFLFDKHNIKPKPISLRIKKKRKKKK